MEQGETGKGHLTLPCWHSDYSSLLSWYWRHQICILGWPFWFWWVKARMNQSGTKTNLAGEGLAISVIQTRWPEISHWQWEWKEEANLVDIKKEELVRGGRWSDIEVVKEGKVVRITPRSWALVAGHITLSSLGHIIHNYCIYFCPHVDIKIPLHQASSLLQPVGKYFYKHYILYKG